MTTDAILAAKWTVVLLLQTHLFRVFGPWVWGAASVGGGVLVAVAAGGAAPSTGAFQQVAEGAALGVVTALAGQALVGAASEAAGTRPAPAVPVGAATVLAVAAAAAFALGMHRTFLASAVALERAAGIGASLPAVTRIEEVASHAFVLAVTLATPAVFVRAGSAVLVRLASGPWPTGGAGSLAAWGRLALSWIAVAAAMAAHPEAYGRAVFDASMWAEGSLP
ncbi:MAG: hypothetical protein D6705_12005 [Deltaproteobacteria bacterium]|nr:MAG: hypothetical protein D6705_12005 [Deltaproteobacteria bacterium]